MSTIRTAANVCLRPLGELVTFLDHRRRPVREADRKPGPYPYLGANGQQGTIDGYLFDERLVLLAEDGGHFDEPERGIAYRVSGKVWVNNHAHVLRPSREVDWGYLTRALENLDIRPYVSGTTRAKLTKGQAEKILVPVAPVVEQRRIAAILDQADALREKRRAALAQLDEMAQAIFVEMFLSGSSRRNPWPEVKIASLVRSVRTGPFGSQLLHSEFVDDGVAVLGIDNAVQNEFAWAERRYITPEKYGQLSRYRVYPGDVIVTIMGTCGRAAIVPDDIPLSITTKHLCSITLDQGRCLPAYLHACLLLHPAVLRQLGVNARGAVMPGLNMGLIRDTEMTLPPIEVQREFASRRSALKQIQMQLTRSQADLDTLFASLQHRAFCGEL